MYNTIMKKVLFWGILFLGCAGIVFGEEMTEIKPISIPLIEPLEIRPVTLIEAPETTLPEEKIKVLKEKEALPSIEDVQNKEENSPEVVRETQSAVTDYRDENSNGDDNVIELNLTTNQANKTQIQLKPANNSLQNNSKNDSQTDNIQFNYGTTNYPFTNSGSIYRF